MTTVLAITGLVLLALIGNRLLQARGVTQVGAEAARTLLADQSAILLDVRTPAEFRTGHLKRARNIPVGELAARVGELGDDTARQVLVYCASGSRSLAAAQILRRNGFTNVSNLRGGLRFGGASLDLVK